MEKVSKMMRPGNLCKW